MYRIAISGHRGLPAPTASLVDQSIRAALAERTPDVTGLSCLADGADQIFACAVTELGGTLEAVIPATEYRERLPADSHPAYDDLLAQATVVHRRFHVRRHRPEENQYIREAPVAVSLGRPSCRARAGTTCRTVRVRATQHGLA